MRGFLKTILARLSLVTAIVLCVAAALLLTGYSRSASANRFQDLTVQAGFDGKTVTPEEAIELTLNRPVSPAEGRIAVVVGSTDLTDLFVVEGASLKYSPRPFPLPAGENDLTVYLVAPGGEWKPVASFKLKVGVKAETVAETVQTASGEQATQTASNEQATQPVQTQTAEVAQAAAQTQAVAEPVKRRFGFDKFDLAPALNIGFKSQFAETHFPDSNKPERPTFADATLQGTWKSEMARGTFNMKHQFDIVGSSFRNEALRFAEQGANARKIELSSYLMEFQHGTRKFNIGHSSIGAQRHLLNNFSSRGFTIASPISKNLDVSLVAMNSTNVVGFDNFFGLANQNHRLYGGVVCLVVFFKCSVGFLF